MLREGARACVFHYLVQGPLTNPQDCPNRFHSCLHKGRGMEEENISQAAASKLHFSPLAPSSSPVCEHPHSYPCSGVSIFVQSSNINRMAKKNNVHLISWMISFQQIYAKSLSLTRTHFVHERLFRIQHTPV